MKAKRKTKRQLHIEIAASGWKRLRGLSPRLKKAAALVLAKQPRSLQPAASRAAFTLLLTTNAAVRRLNHDFRGLDKTTNVLSFPHFTRAQLEKWNKEHPPLAGGSKSPCDFGEGSKETPSPAKTKDLLRKPRFLLPLPQGERDILYIGDIAVAYQYTVDEAGKEYKIPCHHVTHLLIHGLLHLFGYDHATDAAAVRMERLEKKLMAELGLPDPYAPVPTKAPPARRKKRKPA